MNCLPPSIIACPLSCVLKPRLPGSTAISRRLKFLARELQIPVVALAQVNRDLLTRGQRATREALAWLGDTEAEVYSASGTTTSGAPTGPRLVNEAL